MLLLQHVSSFNETHVTVPHALQSVSRRNIFLSARQNICVFQQCESTPAWHYFKDWNPGKDCFSKQNTPETITSFEVLSSSVVLSHQAADKTCYIR